MTKNSKKIPQRASRRSLSTGQRVTILFGIIGILLIGTVTGLLPYSIAFARCLKPPILASTFAASYSYEMPGDSTYGPGPFISAYYCSPSEAEAAGFQRTPFQNKPSHNIEHSKADVAQQAQ
jgi:hypothetical protein